jgi:hypothetical protein
LHAKGTRQCARRNQQNDLSVFLDIRAEQAVLSAQISRNTISVARKTCAELSTFRVPHDAGAATFQEGAADNLQYPILIAPSWKANFPS